MPPYEKITIVYRAILMFSLYVLLARTGNEMAGLLLFLILLVLMLLRWRFPIIKWTLLIDQAFIIYASALWEDSFFASALIVFDALYLGYPALIIPILLYAAFNRPDLMLAILLMQSVFAGLSLRGWRNQQQISLKQIDDAGKKLYESENLKQELLIANVQVARMAELSERSRIAGEIHDHAGHEIIAAFMSLQTAQVLLKNDISQAEHMLREATGRLQSGIVKIRDAVHNLAPFTEMGINALRKLCEEFKSCPVELIVYGDPHKVPVHLWVILESCLKESLTNVLRHTKATNVQATLDITRHIVRFCIENNGIKESDSYPGLGLNNLRMRAKAIGGSISYDLSDRFSLVCVLPIERTFYEHPNC